METWISTLEDIQGAERNYDLKKVIWEILPEAAGVVAKVDVVPQPDDPARIGFLTARDIAKRIGADLADVEAALDEMVESAAQVLRSDTNHDGPHYWKRPE